MYIEGEQEDTQIERLHWEENQNRKKTKKKVETKSKHRDMRRQQERGEKSQRNEKTTLCMRNSRSSCASCILVSTCMCVCLGVCVAFGTHVCGCPVSRIHKTTQIPAVFSQASLADSANRAQNLYLFICVMVCPCIFLILYFWSEHKTRKCNRKIHI